MGFLTPLNEDEQTTFIVVSLDETVLRKLVGRLGTAPKGTRLDSLSVWELADTLVDYYVSDAEVAPRLLPNSYGAYPADSRGRAKRRGRCCAPDETRGRYGRTIR